MSYEVYNFVQRNRKNMSPNEKEKVLFILLEETLPDQIAEQIKLAKLSNEVTRIADQLPVSSSTAREVLFKK